MINPFSRGFLLDRAGEAVAEAPPKLDPGTPFVHDDKPTPKETPKLEKAPIDKEVERLTAELRAAKDENKRVAESERYWSEKARARQPEPAQDVIEESEEEERVNPYKGEKAEKLLDDLSVEGLDSLLKRGVITEKQFSDGMKKLAASLEQRIDEKLNTATRHNQMDAQLAQYPELMEDTKRVNRGEAPQTEMYKRTQANFKEMIEIDPSLRNSPAALVTAARNAKKDIEMEAKLADRERGDKQRGRRERIEATNPDRDAAGSEGGAEPDQLSPQARQVVNGLARFGATEEGFRKFSGRK